MKAELFREDRLIKSLLRTQNVSSSNIASALINDVKAFVGDAEQSDDITLIVVKYIGNFPEMDESKDFLKLTVRNQLLDLEKITAALEHISEKWSLPSKIAMELNLTLEELVTNIIFYAYDDRMEHHIILEFLYGNKGITISITDDGKPFNLLEKVDDSNMKKPLAERKVGGLGIHFVVKMMDEIKYERTNKENIVTLIKYF